MESPKRMESTQLYGSLFDKLTTFTRFFLFTCPHSTNFFVISPYTCKYSTTKVAQTQNKEEKSWQKD